MGVVVEGLNPCCGAGGRTSIRQLVTEVQRHRRVVQERLAKLASVKHGISGLNWGLGSRAGGSRAWESPSDRDGAPLGLRMRDGERCRRAVCGRTA